MMSTRRPGVSLIELLVVMVVVSIMVRVAIPGYGRLADRARAARALSEIEVIRMAAYAYNVDTNEWPADVARGVVPPELVTYLPEGFSFEEDRYLLDWDNWTLPDGTPLHPETDVLLGISMATDDALLGQMLLDLAGEGVARFTIADHYTFIIAAQ